MSYKNVRIAEDIARHPGGDEQKRVILGAEIDDGDDSIRVTGSLPPGHPIDESRAWIWDYEYEEIPAGSEVNQSEILHNTYHTVASEVRIIDDTNPTVSPVAEIDATKYVITVKVDNVRDLAEVLDQIGDRMLDRTDVNPA